MAKHSVTHEDRRTQGLGVGGIDVAKNRHDVQWLDTNGRPVGKAFRCANTRAGFEAMGARQPSEEVRVGLGSTGPYWLGLAHGLRAQGAEVVWVQSAHVHRLKAWDDYPPTQTDAHDARVIARMAFEDRGFRWEPRAGALAPLTPWAVTRRQHHQDVMRWRSRSAGWLPQYVPEFLTGFKAWEGKAAWTVWDSWPTPDWVFTQSLDTWTDRLKAATPKRVGAQRAHAWYQAAMDSMGIPESRATARLLRASSLQSWRAALAKQRAMEEKQVAILTDWAPAQLLFRMPGCGTQVIAPVLGEWGDWSRFTDARQAQKMAGLNLTQSSSGHHQGQTPLAKGGRPATRAVLYQAAGVEVAKDPQWKMWYQPLPRRAAHPLAPKAARVAVATTHLRVAWVCMKYRPAYDAARLFPVGEVSTAASRERGFGSVSGVGSCLPPEGLSRGAMTPYTSPAPPS
ncbi:MAG: IS110 family transposase [Firmicutes bacterium]|nr:IS110 family transposase [Bacillota bacterium]